ncbi:gephyrin-like molybdotransferase Glp [Gaopeijia maritima]|uniref:molybdopterin molybdotransferase MoeA n=1 Tax=Gaopeijia maritima TaxID=3119007 RepID=UPI003247DDAF
MTDRPEFEQRDADWLGVHEALECILGRHAPLPAVAVPLGEALGRTLAEAAIARARLPPWDNSAMDGYAVRSADLAGASETAPVELEVIGVARAGASELPEVGPGQACRIMTGAPLPPGADGVTRVEYTDGESGREGWVRIHSEGDAGRNVRPGGQDMERGDAVAPAGVRIDSGWTALLAAAGVDPVPVHRAPEVLIVTGGDELRSLDAFHDVVEGRAIPDTNAPMLAAAVRAAGGRPRVTGPARDDAADLRRHLAQARDADLVVTVGGASMGEADLLKRTFEEDGLEVDFWRVRMRPGSPMAFGHLPRPGGGPPLPLLSLPGNPASAFVTFQLFGHPLVRHLSGDPRPHRPVIAARAGERLGSTPRLCHFHRVVIDPAAPHDPLPTVRLAGHAGSGLVHSLGPAAGLAVVPEGIAAIEQGERVEVVLLRDTPGAHAPAFADAR